MAMQLQSMLPSTSHLPQTQDDMSPQTYFEAVKQEGQLPVIVLKRITDIIEEYAHMKPELQKRKEEVATLYQYNKKMLETIEEFMQHEKKIIGKYNKITDIFVNTFKRYLPKKNIEDDFSWIKPVKSVFDSFSMNDWKFEPAPSKQNVYDHRPYQESLCQIIKAQYFSNFEGLKFQLKTLNRPHARLKAELDSLSRQQITPENMFELVRERRHIEQRIREADGMERAPFLEQGLDFINQVTRLHSVVEKQPLEKLVQYIQNEKQVRRGLRSKCRKFWQGIETEWQRIEGENETLVEQNKQMKITVEELTKERNEMASKYQYLQLKAGASSRKGNSSNASILVDDLRNTNPRSVLHLSNNEDVKKDQQQRKQLEFLENRVASLEAKIKELNRKNKQLMEEQEKWQANHPMNSNSDMDEVKLKLCAKLLQKGIEDTYQMTCSEMLDKLIEKLTGTKMPGADDKQSLSIRITSAQKDNQGSRSHSAREIPIGSQAERDLTCSIKAASQIRRSRLYSKDEVSEHGKIEMVQQSQQTSQPELVHESTQTHELHESYSDKKGPKRRQTLNIAFTSSHDLHSISEHRSEEESRLGSDPKITEFVKEHVGPRDEDMHQLNQLQDQVATIRMENEHLKDELEVMNRKTKKMSEDIIKEQKKPKFKALCEALELTQASQATQIEGLCLSVARKLAELDSQDFQMRVKWVYDALSDHAQEKHEISDDIPPQTPQLGPPHIPKLSTFSDPSLAKSQSFSPLNMIAHKFGATDSPSINSDAVIKNPFEGNFKMRQSEKEGNFIKRSQKLTLASGEIKILLPSDKSSQLINHSFEPGASSPGIRPSFNMVTSNAVENSKGGPGSGIIPNAPDRFETSMAKVGQDELISQIRQFEHRSKRTVENDKDNSVLEQSLGFSQSNIKSIEHIKQSLNRPGIVRLLKDEEMLTRLEKKIDDIKDQSDDGSELYWFYKKYKQVLEALQRSQELIRQHERNKELCVTQLTAQDASLSRHKLEEKIYFLQQRVKTLEGQLVEHKEAYEEFMNEQFTGLDDLKKDIMKDLVKYIMPMKEIVETGKIPFLQLT